MTTRKVSRVRLGLGMVLAVVFGAGGVIAVPDVALAAPWTVTSMADDPVGQSATALAQSLVGPGVTVNSATFVGLPPVKSPVKTSAVVEPAACESVTKRCNARGLAPAIASARFSSNP